MALVDAIRQEFDSEAPVTRRVLARVPLDRRDDEVEEDVEPGHGTEHAMREAVSNQFPAMRPRRPCATILA